jgi:FAD/FMN-containing dehydrogenase
LATVLGYCSTVGIAGYTLGGGLGRLMGKHGAGSDNLLSAEIVDVEGRVLRASPHEREDLFWAIRGDGGNFGIVTSLEYQLHPADQVLGGALTYPISATREVLTFLDEYMMTASDELDVAVDVGNIGMMLAAPIVMESIVTVTVSYCGDLEKGATALKPLRSFRRPLADTIHAMPYLDIQVLDEDIRPLAEFGSTGGSMALESTFIERFGPEAIDRIVNSLEDPPPFFWFTAEHYMHGAVCRIEPTGTALALRRPGYSSRVFAAWRESSQADLSLAWVKRLVAALEPFTGDAKYLSYLTSGAGDADVRAAYRPNYERLVSVKNRYDPINFFSSNRNIHPQAAILK